MPLVTLMLPLNSSDVPELRFLRDFTLAVSNPWGTPSSPRTHLLEASRVSTLLSEPSPQVSDMLCMGMLLLCLSPDTVTVGFRLCLSSQRPFGSPSPYLERLTALAALYKVFVHEWVHLGSLCHVELPSRQWESLFWVPVSSWLRSELAYRRLGYCGPWH